MKVFDRRMFLSAGLICLFFATGFVAPGCASFRMSGAGHSASSGEPLRMLAKAPVIKKSCGIVSMEKFMPAEVRVGQPFDFEILVRNRTNSQADDVAVTEKISSKFKIIESTPKPESTQADVVQWNLGSLKPREVKTIKIKAVAESTDPLPYCTSVIYKQVLCATARVIAPKMTLALEAPAETLACDKIPVKYTVTNSGVGQLRDVRIKDDLPEGLMTTAGRKTVTFDIGSLKEGGSRSFNATLKAARPGTFSQSAEAVAAGGLKVSAKEVKTVVEQPVLKLTQSSPSEVTVGKAIEYKVVVTNVGDADSKETVLESTLPLGIVFASATGGGETMNGKIVWKLGLLHPDESKTVIINYTAKDIITAVSKSTVRAYGFDEVTTSSKTTVKGIPAVALEVIDVDDPIKAGKVEKYLITAINQGAVPDTNILIKIKLDDDLSYVSSSGPTKIATQNGNAVEFAPLTTLAPKQKAVWEVNVKAVAAGVQFFQVTLTCDQLDHPATKEESTHVDEPA